MIRLRRGYRLVALTVIAWAWAAEVLPAQMADHPPKTPPTLALAKAGVPVGGVVYVTDPTGRTIKGKLATLTSDDVQVRIGATVHSFAAAEILRIRWQQPDSPLTGALIGAAIGAIPGIYWMAVDPNECAGMCAEEYALIGIGAVVGAMIDRAVTRKVTVYVAGAPTRRPHSVTVLPVISREHKGIQAMLRF